MTVNLDQSFVERGGPGSAPIADALVHIQCAYTSLARSAHVGMLSRETPFFARARPLIGRAMVMVSYGGPEDERLAMSVRPDRWAGAFDCVSNRENVEPARFQAGVPARVLEHLRATGCRSALVATDQHYGGEVAVQTTRALREAGLCVGLVARCGYHWSWTVARDTAPDDPRAVAAAMLEGELCRAADMVVATTRRIAESLAWQHHLKPDRVVVVPNFVVPPGEAPGAEERQPGLVLFAGRLEAEKRPDLLIRAIALVRKRVPNARLAIVGDGSLGDSLRALARTVNAPVEFHGRLPHDQLLRMMGRCAVYAQVSRFEGHPKTIIEALSMGAPCVVTRAPGVDEEIAPDRTGIVCGDRPEDIADAISGLLLDRDRATRIGAAAAADVRSRLTLDAVWPRMEAAWRLAMNAAGAGAGTAMPVVRWEQTLLNAGPDGAALQFADSIGAYAKRLAPEARRLFLDALGARVGSVGEQMKQDDAARAGCSVPRQLALMPGVPAAHH